MNYLFQIVYFFVVINFAGLAQVSAQNKPDTFILNGEQLLENKLKVKAGSLAHQQAVRTLVYHADKVLPIKPYTIVNKSIAPPSGNKHDYMSLATYWWPNPLTPDGLPYIRKDGQTNPEINEIKDNKYVARLSKDIELLGLAYYFTGNEKYAQKATDLLCAFFIDKETRMNPNLNYATAIRGKSDGRGAGLIEVHHFTRLIDGAQLLQGSESWTKANHTALKSWFGTFVDWILNSPIGKRGIKEPNNIGTFYDLQVITYAVFSDNNSLAKSYLKNTTLKRINTQFKEDGKQPYELNRTRSWTYSIKNLQGWCSIAAIGEKVGVDVWHYTSDEGKSLKQGLLWMLPYASGQKEWNFKEMKSSDVKLNWFTPIATKAQGVYKDQRFQEYLAGPAALYKAGKDPDYSLLLY